MGLDVRIGGLKVVGWWVGGGVGWLYSVIPYLGRISISLLADRCCLGSGLCVIVERAWRVC